jgi:lipoprotein-anchoring transpeptidase ErfK/SrfK
MWISPVDRAISELMRHALVFVLAAALACAAAPDAARTPQIAAGVRLGSLDLTGMTAEPARTAIEASLAQPVPVVLGDTTMYAWPDALRLNAPVEDAVAAALVAAPSTRVTLPAHWSDARLKRFVAQVARGFDRLPVDAELVTIAKRRPVIREATPGLAVGQALLARELARALRTGNRTPIAIPTHGVPAQRTRAHFGPVVWIDRGTNTLRLYDSTKLVRAIRVATGQSAYPTPSGLWHVVDKQVNPWWRPPDSPWARGAVPIPPGPGNPLGTRWMGLDAAGVGMHGTPDAASIGYSASHGCIRMQIPDAEWLFTHVEIGTPVYIT